MGRLFLMVQGLALAALLAFSCAVRGGEASLPAELRGPRTALSSTDPNVRAQGAFDLGLGGAAASGAVPDLIGLLGDKEQARVTRDYRAWKSTGGGAESIASYSTTVGDEARAALCTITGQDFGADRDAWRAWWKSQRR